MNARRFDGVFPIVSLLLALPGLALAQSLTLASGSAQPGDTIPLNLSLSGTSASTQPASLQFTLTYNAADFSAVAVALGAVATNAGKSVTCNPSSGQVVCMIFGINTTGMGDGVVAVANVTLSTSSTSTSRAIQLTGVVGADPSGNQIAITATGGVVQVVSTVPSSPTISTFGCSPATVNTPGSSVCTVGLTQQAPSGGVSVSVNSNTGNISVPASVTVAGGASTASFTASAASVAADTSGQITAALNGSSQAVVLTLLSPASLTSLACTPSSLGSGASATCTVSLSKAVTANTAVAVSDNSASLTVPTSVTVAAGALSGSFAATAGTLTTDSTATLNASLNGVLVSTSLSLVSPAVLTSMVCTPTSLGSGASATCTVSLSKAVTANTAVAVSDNNASLTVPTSVTVAAGALSGSFAATAGTLTTDSTATVTASLNGVTQPASLSLVSPAVLTSLVCTPTSLGSGASATCTVSLSKAVTANTVVAVSDNNASLTVPTSVTVAAGASSGSFAATAGTLTTDSTATVTASLNGVTQSATLSLVSPVLLTSLSCTPSSLGSGASSSCTVVLSKAATANTSIATFSNNAALIVPASVTVAMGASSGNFAATAGTVTTDTQASVTASLNGGSKTATVSLVSAAALTSVSCSPATVSSGGTTSCGVTLSKAVTANTSVGISVNNSSLTVPTSVTVSAGLASATFTGTAGSVTANQTVTVTATYSGASVATTVTVQAPAVQLSSLSCTPTTVTTPGTANCTVTLNASATATTTIALASSSGSVSVPASVSVGSGGTSAAFTANASSVSSQTTVQVTASYNGVSKAASLTLQPPAAPTVSSLQCTPNPVMGGSATQCTVMLSAPAPSGGQSLQVSDNSRNVSVPSSVTVPGGSTLASFQASASQVSQNATATIQAAMKSGKTITSSASYSLTISGPPALTSLACSPSTIANNQYTTCTAAVASVTPVDLNVAISSNKFLSKPNSVVIRAGQSSAAFSAQAQSSKNTTVTVTASLNGVSVKTTVTISSTAPAVNAPHLTTSMDREPVEFEVSATDPQDLPVTVAAGALPAGASFDVATGRFRWAPGESRHGDYTAVFTATNSMGQRTQSQVLIQVRPGQPVIEQLVHGATGSVEQVCSPGALAKVMGEGLVSRRDGEEAQVWVNGSSVPVMRRTEKALLFQCPGAPAGTKLAVEVHRGAAVSNAVETVMVDAAPGIFSLDGTGRGQGVVMLTEFHRVAMVRSPGDVSQPATATDRITLQVTGLGEDAGLNGVQLQVGAKRVAAEWVAPVSPGVWQITGRLPEGVAVSDAVPVQLVMERYGQVLRSNVVTIAIEGRDLGMAKE